MPAYNILAVKTSDDDDVLYPALDKKLVPILEPPDGPGQLTQFSLKALSVYHSIDGTLTKMLGGDKVSANGLLTDQRLIVYCTNYDVVRWNGSNSISSAVIGAGTETAFHLGEKALHRIKARGKAMVGHLYYPWIRSVAWQPDRGRKSPAALRLCITKKMQDGSTKDLYLNLTLDGRLDPAELARHLVQRVAAWWLIRDPGGLKEQTVQVLEGLRSAELLQPPPPGRVSVYQLPVYRFPLPNGVPAEMVNSARRQAAGVADISAPSHTASALRPERS